MPADITPTELKALWDRGESPFVLDVREPWELEIVRLPRIVHIAMNALPERLAELPRTCQIIVMCRSGARSLRVAHYLEQNGFPEVANLSGGILAWQEQVDPTIPVY